WVWQEEELVVERYISNREGRFWRAFVLFGKVVVCAGEQAEPIKELTGGTVTGFYAPGAEPFPNSVADNASAVAEAALVIAKELSVDYGAIDFVESEGRDVYCVDINCCPHFVEW